MISHSTYSFSIYVEGYTETGGDWHLRMLCAILAKVFACKSAVLVLHIAGQKIT